MRISTNYVTARNIYLMHCQINSMHIKGVHDDFIITIIIIIIIDNLVGLVVSMSDY